MPIQIENGKVEIVAKEIPPAIPKTYAELATLVAGNLLIVGQDYLLTDFATHYQIPNTTDFHTGSTEHLILTAVTTSSFCEDVCSQEFPTDKISYEFVDSSGFGGDKGRITYRKDTVNDIAFGEDWRNTVYRRWSLAATPTVFDQLTDVDLTGVFLDSPMVNLANNIGDIEVDSIHGAPYSNNVFYGNANRCRVRSLFIGNTFFGEFRKVIMGGSCSLNIFYGDFSNSTTGNNFSANIFKGFCNNLYALDNFSSNVFSGNVNNFRVLNNFQFNVCNGDIDSSTIGNNANNNVLNLFLGNTIGINFQNNTINDNFSLNKVGSNFISNTVPFTDNGLTANTFDDAVSGCTFNGFFSFNSMGVSSSSNTFQNAQFNKFGIFCISNIFGQDFNQNIVPDNVSLTTFPDNTTGMNPEIKNTTTITSDITLSIIQTVVVADASGGNITITLPNNPPFKTEYEIKRIDNSVNTVTIQTQGTNLIFGSTSEIINQYEVIELAFDGINNYL